MTTAIRTKKRKFCGSQERSSEIVRKELETEPVNRARTPRWVLTVVKEAIKAKKLPLTFPLLSADAALEHATNILGGSWNDHTGAIKLDGHDYLVAEPYSEKISPTMLEELEKFVALFDGRYRFDSNSGHYPGRTVRIWILND